MKPSLKLLYLSLERAAHNYAATGSPFARERALAIIKDMRACLNDIEGLIQGDPEPETQKLEAIR